MRMECKCFFVISALCFAIASASDESFSISEETSQEPEVCDTTSDFLTTLPPTCPSTLSATHAVVETTLAEPEPEAECEETQCEAPPIQNHTRLTTGEVIEKLCPNTIYDVVEMSVSGCPEGVLVCEQGYYRNPSGACVLLQDCPTICSENEILTRLVYPLNEIPKGQPGFKCICRAGFNLNKEGKCVKEILPCGPNSKRVECGTACPITCKSYLLPRQPCALPCIPDSCVCYDGFVMNDFGQCVSPSECPGGSACPTNSEWRMCVNPNPITCDMLTKKQIPDCSKTCPGVFTCQCKMGYVHRSATDATCVPVDQCFMKKAPLKVLHSAPMNHNVPNGGVQVVPRLVSYNQKPPVDVVPNNAGPVKIPSTE